MRRYLSLFLASLALALPQPQSGAQDVGSEPNLTPATPSPEVEATADCPKYGGPSQGLNACQYNLYQTDQWLQQYLQTLLKKNGVTSTKNLKDPWPSYMWKDYQLPLLSWVCPGVNNCLNQPMAPPATASNDQINAFFVLQSVDKWVAYMQSLYEVTRLSTLNNFGLDEAINAVTPGPGRLPNGTDTRTFHGNLITQVVVWVLGQFPRPPLVSPGMSGYSFISAWLSPAAASDYTFDKIEDTFVLTTKSVSDSLSGAFNAFLKDSDFARDFLYDGGFLEPPSSVTEAWRSTGTTVSFFLGTPN
jgi:hypothetical protein